MLQRSRRSLPSERRIGIAKTVALFALSFTLSCGSDGPSPSEAAVIASDVERARALLDPTSRLPSRVEGVALCDAVAVSASKEASPQEQARLFRLAADLRVRLWRLDRADADGHEALELFGESARALRGSEDACEADRARSLFAGELHADANVTYRHLYLTKRKHAALSVPPAQSECVEAIERHLAMAQAHRPTGAELLALEKEGDRTELLSKTTATASGEASAAAAGPAPSSRDIVVSPSSLAPAKGPVKITKIDKYSREGGGRVVVHLSSATSFKVGALDADAGKDARVFVDIDKASSKGVAKEIEVGGAIKRIRSGHQPNGTRIVLDLSAKMHRRVFYLPEPFRIVIDVSDRAPEAFEPNASGKRTVKRVAIDPGHGGDDPGAVGPTGLKEKDVALDIAHRVAPLLAEELKIETLLTRDSDVFVPLDERTARANAFHADLFVSIHCNASETGEAHGIEVFILDELKDVSRAAARVAALENGIGIQGALDPAALDAEMASIAGRLGSGQVAASSRTLGLLLGRATLASLSQKYPGTSDHGLKSAGFYVLAGAEMPAVLFETSFISNPDDEAKLAKADYKQKLADGIVNAIRAYRDGKN